MRFARERTPRVGQTTSSLPLLRMTLRATLRAASLRIARVRPRAQSVRIASSGETRVARTAGTIVAHVSDEQAAQPRRRQKSRHHTCRFRTQAPTSTAQARAQPIPIPTPATAGVSARRNTMLVTRRRSHPAPAGCQSLSAAERHHPREHHRRRLRRGATRAPRTRPVAPS